MESILCTAYKANFSKKQINQQSRSLHASSAPIPARDRCQDFLTLPVGILDAQVCDAHHPVPYEVDRYKSLHLLVKLAHISHPMAVGQKSQI